MNFYTIPILSLFFLSLSLAAIPKKSLQKHREGEVVERIVAFINGDILTLGELDTEIAMRTTQLGLTQHHAKKEKFKLKVLNTMIDNMLIIQNAAKQGLHIPEKHFEDWKKEIIRDMHLDGEKELIQQVELQGSTIEKLRKKFMDSILIQEMKRREIQKKISISKEEIENFYRDRIDEFTPPAKIRIRELVIFIDDHNPQRAKNLIEEVRTLIESSDLTFSEVAKVNSQSNSKSMGGDLGFFSLSELNEHFRATVESLEVGEVSQPIHTDQAFYLLTVDAKKGGSPIPLKLVREQITQSLWQDKESSIIQGFLSNLRKQALIKIQL